MNRLIVVSNRLPFALDSAGEDLWTVTPAVGGLVIDQDGTLILSQFAGAAEQLKPDALLVNPYDIEQMADTIVKAFRMTPAERTARMKRLRRMVRKENVFWWVDSFLAAGS